MQVGIDLAAAFVDDRSKDDGRKRSRELCDGESGGYAPARRTKRFDSGWTRFAVYTGELARDFRVIDPHVSTGRAAMRLILLILVVVLLIGALPSWPYSTGWGYYPAGGLGTILVILIILALLGVL